MSAPKQQQVLVGVPWAQCERCGRTIRNGDCTWSVRENDYVYCSEACASEPSGGGEEKNR